MWTDSRSEIGSVRKRVLIHLNIIETQEQVCKTVINKFAKFNPSSRVMRTFINWYRADPKVVQFDQQSFMIIHQNENEPQHEISNNVVCATSKA